MSRVRWFELLLGTYLVGMLAIGRFYDPRLMIGPVNIAFTLAIPYFLIVFKIVTLPSFFLNKGMVQLVGLVLILLLYQGVLLFRFGSYNIHYYTFHKLINFIALAVLPGIIFSSRKGLAIFMDGIIGFTSLFFFIGLVYLIMGKTGDRMAVLGGGPIVFARWISVFVLLVLTSNLGIRLKLVISALGIFLIIAAGSKGPFIAFAVAAFYLLARRVSLRQLIFISIPVVFFAVFGSLATQLSNSRITNGLDSPSNLTSVVSRLEKLNVAKELISAHPLGIGFGNFPKYGRELNEKYILEVDYPHNVFAEVAVELGLPWLVAFLFCLQLAWRRRVRESNNGFIEAMFIVLLINTQFSGDLSNSKFLIITMIILIFSGQNRKTDLV